MVVAQPTLQASSDLNLSTPVTHRPTPTELTDLRWEVATSAAVCGRLQVLREVAHVLNASPLRAARDADVVEQLQVLDHLVQADTARVRTHRHWGVTADARCEVKLGKIYIGDGWAGNYFICAR